MQLFSGKTKIDFMGKRMLTLLLSATLFIISIGSLAANGLNLGIDFTGGYLVEVHYPETADLVSIRKTLETNGVNDAQVQNFGTSKDVLIRLAPQEGINSATLGDTILSILRKSSDADTHVEMRRIEYVGPQVGEELRDQGGLAMLVALFFILVYISFRFQFKSALGAITALIHDVVIVTGVFSVLQMDFDLSVLAAILAVIGYSLNDTVVVLDRIRETFRNVRKGTPLEVLNLSINQTLSRTLMTSLTTLLVLLSLFFLGGEVIHNFAFALIIGVLIGTYSSIYVASTMLVFLDIKKQDFMVQTKEELVDDRP